MSIPLRPGLPGYNFKNCSQKPKTFVFKHGNKKYLNVEVPTTNIVSYNYEIYNKNKRFSSTIQSSTDNPMITIPFETNKKYFIKIEVVRIKDEDDEIGEQETHDPYVDDGYGGCSGPCCVPGSGRRQEYLRFFTFFEE